MSSRSKGWSFCWFWWLFFKNGFSTFSSSSNDSSIILIGLLENYPLLWMRLLWRYFGFLLPLLPSDDPKSFSNWLPIPPGFKIFSLLIIWPLGGLIEKLSSFDSALISVNFEALIYWEFFKEWDLKSLFCPSFSPYKKLLNLLRLFCISGL